jgi:predicted metalloprotease
VLAIGLLVIAGCAVQQSGVEATRSRQNDGNLIDSNTPDDTTVDTTVDTTPIPVAEGIIDFGANKPERAYDGYLTAAFSDIEAFWTEQFPALYGTDFAPLSGGIYAAYPERTEKIPGCGTPETTYLDVEGNAFYCVDGDFMVYDDSELLPQLVDELGQSAVAVVLAHEFGHAVQVRAGAFNEATILKEQQADCFAGAWTAHVSRGESEVINFTDEDIAGGLIAMIEVRDPVKLGGTIDSSSHGTGFDRVGAFQDGFIGGPERCKTFFTEDRETQLVNIPFDFDDVNEGNLPLIDANPITPGEPQDVVTLLPASLTRFWTDTLAASNLTLTPPTVTLFSPETDDLPTCEGIDSSQFERNVLYCAPTNTIYIDQDFAQQSIANDLLGDMSIGFLVSQGYSENVQTVLGSQLQGEARVLLDDCLSGVWAKDITPPIPKDREDTTVLSAGDLDEAVVTAIVHSDRTADTDVNGTAFERVDAFRAGVLGGMQTCQDRITP